MSPCPLSIAHRPTVPAWRSGVCRPPLQKACNNKQRKKRSCGKTHPLESKRSHVTAPCMAIQPRTEQANALSSESKSRRCAAGKSSVFERFRATSQFSHQTAADTHREVEGWWKRAIRATVAPSTRHRLLAVGRSKTVVDAQAKSWPNISHMQYTYEVTVVWLRAVAPASLGFRDALLKTPAECRNWRLVFDGIYIVGTRSGTKTGIVYGRSEL